MIKSGLCSVSFRQLPAERVIELAAAAQLQGIEWGSDVHAPAGNLAIARQLRHWCREAGIAISSYGSYYRVAAPDQPAPFQAVLDSAVALEAPIIRVWAGPCGSAEADLLTRDRVAEESRKIAEQADIAGVQIAFEFHGGTLTDTNESAMDLLRRIDHPNIRCYWQPPLQYSETERIEGMGMITPWLSHLHVFHWRTNGDGGIVRLPLAEGASAWKKYLTAARTVPGDRYALLEFVRDNSPQQLHEDARSLRELLLYTEVEA